MNRNKIFIITGSLIAILLVAVLFLLQFIQGTIADSNENAYIIEIENCPPIAEKNQLDVEIAAIFSSTELKNNGSFLTPIVKINKLNGISTPAFGMNYFKYKINPLMYLFDSRAEDESLFFKSYVQNNAEFTAFKKEAENGSKNEPNVIFDMANLTTQFFIHTKQKDKIDNTKKIFNSLQSLRSHLDELIKNDKITKGTTVKIYYLCDGLESLMDDDQDGIMNNKDKCPKDKGTPENRGCPDTDKDGVHDGEDQCIDKAGDKECFGCKCPPPPPCPGDADDDKDGICNKQDKCPNQFGNYRGCPDNDRDGVLNADDKCPNVAGEIKCNGCKCPEPDRDGDGVFDKADKCPDVKGTSSDGCPLKVGVKHDNSTGIFLLNGISSVNDVDAFLEITQRSGRVITQSFTNLFCPTKPEADKLLKILNEPVYMKVDVVVKDKNGKEILRERFENLSLLCTKDMECGFIDTRK
jgi:hypothetical protein